MAWLVGLSIVGAYWVAPPLEYGEVSKNELSSARAISISEVSGAEVSGVEVSDSEVSNSQIQRFFALQSPQNRQGGRGFGRGRTTDRSEYDQWQVKNFADDVFTFVRVQYDSFGRVRRGRQWDNDYPDCDWNFSVRLHQLTSMKVDPNGKVVRLTSPELFDFPFVFMSNINQINLSDDECEAMRRYCLNGGFVMADDFWAPQSWEHVRNQMEFVFPNRKPRELKRSHPIFNIVYNIQGKPQVPSIRAWRMGDTFEYWHGDPQGDEDPHFWGYFDDDGRLMALMCHNNDIGDGWEREGENKEYFSEYSERVSYPLGINIITYAMTH